MPKLTAKSADKYDLYEQSVQCVEADIDFVDKTFKKLRGRKPATLREDFCGSFAAAIEFVNRRKGNRAVAVDLDPAVLEWGRVHNLPSLNGRHEDLTVLQADVLSVETEPMDVILAMNFSYYLFKERAQLLAYFARVLESLGTDGVLVMDAYGGTEAGMTVKEKKKKKGFTYVWHQAKFNPITSEAVNHIHFEFPDGTKIRKAFSYEWRLWTLREITDLLAEVGFASAEVYWEGWDEKQQEGNGVFRRTRKAENCEGWIAYIVACK